ncbi:MAG: SAM-dependent methyltransferase [Gammaproteobacteria bacterium]|nr:MAG: SAM-dependent methyltransferase [Gammaproteobacteria bacterium]
MNEAHIWDRLARYYDLVVRPFDTSYARVRERLSRDLPSGGHLLEVAAGTGQFTADLANRSEHLVATDISPEMVLRLRERVSEKGLPGVECAVMSADDLDADDRSFDGVFCANALHVMNDPAQGLSEFHRVLKPQGILVAPTFLHNVDGFRRGLSRTLSLVSPFVAHTRFDLASLEQTITAAGFEVIITEQLPGLFPIGYIVACPLEGAGTLDD